jgi:hypothetical protein
MPGREELPSTVARSSRTKDELVEAIGRANDRHTAAARS